METCQEYVSAFGSGRTTFYVVRCKESFFGTYCTCTLQRCENSLVSIVRAESTAIDPAAEAGFQLL